MSDRGNTYGPSGGSPYGSDPFGDPVQGRTSAMHDDMVDRAQRVPLVDPYVVVRTPVVWLLAAIGLGLAGAVLAAFLGESIQLALLAWALAGPLAIGLLAVHSLRDTTLRARLGYDERSTAGTLYATTVLVAAVGIGISAWRIAEWAGRL
jgi:hypothetical protein